MTSVIGHLYGLDFRQEFRKWHSCRPGQLFEAPVVETLDPVGRQGYNIKRFCSRLFRTKRL